AGPEVEEPDVVAVRAEVLGQVRLDGVEAEDPARHPEAVREDHRPLRPAPIAEQAQLDAVSRGEEVDLGRAGPEHAAPAGRGSGGGGGGGGWRGVGRARPPPYTSGSRRAKKRPNRGAAPSRSVREAALRTRIVVISRAKSAAAMVRIPFPTTGPSRDSPRR